MIVCRTPFRISLFGGGTDFPDWYNYNNGLIISGTIDKYCYINVRRLPFIWNFNFRLRYYKTEEVKKVNQIKHGPYREIIKLLKLDKEKIEIIHTADLPALSGLGASSSSTVSAIHALSTFKGQYLSKKQISQLAIYIEQKKLKENVGSQDQIASAFGGFNKISFKKDLDFTVEGFLTKEKVDQLSKSTFLIYTGIQRKSEKIEKEKISNIRKKKLDKNLNNIMKTTNKAFLEFNKKKINLKKIGSLLNKQWEEKKKLSNKITNPTINKICKICSINGAYGTKLLGSGGGGFVFVICPPNKKKVIIKKLNKYKIVNFRFEDTGSTIIYKK